MRKAFVVLLCIFLSLNLSISANAVIIKKQIINNHSIDNSVERVEKLRIKAPPIKPIYRRGSIELSKIQEPVFSTCGSLVYEPPWSVYDFEDEEDKWGIADASFEGNADAHQGWTNVIAAGGPGAGEASMTIWISHGLLFQAPVTDTYTVYFDYSVRGWIGGEITGIDACVSSEVALFFRVGPIEKREDILYQQTIPLVYPDYEQFFNEKRKLKITAEMYEGNGYYIEAIAGIKARAVGALLDSGNSYGQLDDKNQDGWGYGAALNSVRIEWPNHAPDKPFNPQPVDGAIDVDVDVELNWDCYDPDNDELKFDIYFGKNNDPPKIKSDYNSTTFYIPESLDYETYYYWRIVAKDGKGGSSSSEIWSFKTRKEKTRSTLVFPFFDKLIKTFNVDIWSEK